MFFFFSIFTEFILFSEWRPSNRGGYILRDEDSRSNIDGNYKQINTLATYQVPFLLHSFFARTIKAGRSVNFNRSS